MNKTKPSSLSFRKLFDCLLESYDKNIDSLASRSIALHLPLFGADTVSEICKASKEIFMNEQTLLRIQSPFVVVGDIHGHILDLFRVLQTYGLPFQQKYVFLGDFVDRGEFCLETVLIVLLMKILCPKNVYIIRGNHEFRFMCSEGGFLDKIKEIYDDETVFDHFIDTFGYMPLAALIDGSVLCVHGGIGPDLYSLDQINNIKRPFHDFGDCVADSIYWSDPSDNIDFFAPSTRGIGYLFGKDGLNHFLETNCITHLVRAHEVTMQGAIYKFNGKVISVFGASSYCGAMNNSSGVLIIGNRTHLEIKRFPPIPYLLRGNAIFKKDFHSPNTNLKPLAKREVPLSSSSRHLPIIQPESLPPLNKNTQARSTSPSSAQKTRSPTDLKRRLRSQTEYCKNTCDPS